MKISIIAAVAKNLAIGRDNQLLWHIRDDLKLFKHTTLNHVVIMGRKSFESIGKALPNRVNAVITRKHDFQIDGVLVFNSLHQAFDHFRAIGEEEVFVIGGGEIYRQAMDDADVLHISHVDTTVSDADTFFPAVNWNHWHCMHEQQFDPGEFNDFGFTYRKYVRE